MKSIKNRLDWYFSDERFFVGMVCAITVMFVALVALRLVDYHLLGGR